MCPVDSAFLTREPRALFVWLWVELSSEQNLEFDMDAHYNPATILPVDAGRNTGRAKPPVRARLPLGRGSARAAAQTELRPTGSLALTGASPYRIEIVELGQPGVTLGSASTLE